MRKPVAFDEKLGELLPSEARVDTDERDKNIVVEFFNGRRVDDLARKHKLSERRVMQIITRSKVARELKDAVLLSYQADIRRIMRRMLARLEKDIEDEDSLVRQRAMKLTLDVYKLVTPEGTFADKLSINANATVGEDGRGRVVGLLRKFYGNVHNAASAADEIIDVEAVDENGNTQSSA